MISADPVDRAGDHPTVQHEFDGLSAPTHISQHEGEAEPTGQPPLILGGGGILEAVTHLRSREPQASDRGERQDELGSVRGMNNDIPRDPIPAEGAWRQVERRTVGERYPHRRGVCADAQREKSIAEGEAAETEPLLLRTQVGLLGTELLLELPLEIVEQIVPAHEATLST